MFSKACEYGIRAAIFITLSSLKGKRVNLTDISEEIDSPAAFTAKVLQKLVKGDVLESVRGPQGGFYILEEASEKIKLSEIVQIIDGEGIYNGCGLGLKECNILNTCPLHDKFKKVKDDLKEMLQETTLKELATQLKNGTAVLRV